MDLNAKKFPFTLLRKLRDFEKKYLKSVIAGIDYYLKNRKTVPRNYFGKHKWFSENNHLFLRVSYITGVATKTEE